MENRAERSNYRAAARSVTTLLILPAREKKIEKERKTERITNTERMATRTIAIGRSLFSALLRRKRVARENVRKRRTIPVRNGENNIYHSI